MLGVVSSDKSDLSIDNSKEYLTDLISNSTATTLPLVAMRYGLIVADTALTPSGEG